MQAIELFVAPDGSDSNPGTREAPLATPAAARDALRARRAEAAAPGPAVVNLRGGAYRITETLLLEGEEDSGTARPPSSGRRSRAPGRCASSAGCGFPTGSPWPTAASSNGCHRKPGPTSCRPT